MHTIRLAKKADLPAILALFAASEVSEFARPAERAAQIWDATLASNHLFVFVSAIEKGLAATCTLITAPNLLRNGRSHAFLENVVTHPDHRGQGHGGAVVSRALDHGWALDCHHVLMQSGRPDPRVHRFYEKLGFLPGLRTGYVAMRPER
ncbi:GNAT family N-acetyltransferase [Stakelama sp. CBK3Z-3]|uniref:GNAT family N-acetyltransferase n=1 Tax=Stakelama flava TaxID=2860338 RepID=A0ABS6XNW9_9SPHN|nr:GNAT family N-acetyltransferase [Stakelama flava]MBW4331453.1 GNAT family N-acetyltransferase [Stakelama flava]